MADKHIADGEAAFRAVSSVPDVCIVGIVPVPFDSFQTLVRKKQYASTVSARGYSVLNVGSVMAGSQSNLGSGVASGTSLASGDCVILTGSPTVSVEGKPVARHGSQVGMNNMNCIGSLLTLVEPPLVSVENNVIPCNNPPVSSPALEQMKAKKEEMKSSLLGSLRSAVDVSDFLKSGDTYAAGLIDKLRLRKLEGAGSAAEFFDTANEIGAGALRGVLGAGWGVISGTEHLANSAVQFSLSPTAEELSLEAAILAENIRLGNVCADGVLQDAKNALDAAKKSAAEQWDKASHASLGDQAEMAANIVGIIGSLFIGAGEVEVAESVSRASEVTRADELSETINTLDRTVNVADPSKMESANDGIYVTKVATFRRSMSQRRKALLRDALDANSDLTIEQRQFILDNKGNKVPPDAEVSHEIPLYTAITVEGKRVLDIFENMKTQQKKSHRARHKVCGDQYHDFPR
jgi:uncharacterized Zn-binding protein involved in type VI secretion